jgi:hypothetical protein
MCFVWSECSQGGRCLGVETAFAVLCVVRLAEGDMNVKKIQ